MDPPYRGIHSGGGLLPVSGQACRNTPCKQSGNRQVKRVYDTRTKCVETFVITLAAAIIVILEKDMFFETRHVGKLLAARYGETNVTRV